jgi:hypothetical protein
MANNSFLPEDYLEGRAQRRTNLLSLGLFALVLAGITAAAAFGERQRTQVSQLQAQVNSQFEDAAKRLDQLDELQTRKQQMIQKAKVTAALLERVPRTLVLSELINNMPATLSLLEFNLDTRVVTQRITAATALDKAKLEAKKKAEALGGDFDVDVPPTEVGVQIVGVAPTDVQVAQFMTALGRCELFTDLNLVFSEETLLSDHTMRKFRIEMKVNQDVDVQRIVPTRGERLNHNPMAATIQIDAQGKLVTPVEAPAPVRTAQVGK